MKTADYGPVLRSLPPLTHTRSSPPAGTKMWSSRRLSNTTPDPAIEEIALEARVAPLEIATGVRTASGLTTAGFPGRSIQRVDATTASSADFTAIGSPQSSTVHWHGVQVPIEMDGVPGASQAPVEPGGSFTYDFIVPDAGLFWYHPHVMSAAQVGFGLYGPLLVDDPRRPGEERRRACTGAQRHRTQRRPARCSRPTAAASLARCSAVKAVMCSSTAGFARR